tara:strand:- start:378 stop:950 length:573 start_codon:yes stop_codon:yes gene_type:complete
MLKKKLSKIYCIGDSITNGARNEFFRDYVLELNYIFRNENLLFVNKSINGETTSEILKRVINLISYKQINTIIFLGGTNDSKIPTPLNIFKKNIVTLISVCKKNEINLLLVTIPKIFTGLPNYSKGLGNKYIYNYNLIIRNVARGNNIPFVELNGLIEKDFADGIHTNNNGCQKIAKIISKKITKKNASV